MIREYPPMLNGPAENQTRQLRDYLVRLVRYLDEIIQPTEAQVQLSTDTSQIETRIKVLSEQVKRMPQTLFGEASAGDVSFDKPFTTPPVVFVTAGTATNVTETGFTASDAAQWIAVGNPARR